MMCPWAARIGARRSPQPTSDILIDPLQPSDRLDRLSRAAPALVAAPRPGARGRRLRSEGTETALLPVGVFFHRAEVPVPDCPSFIIDVVPSFSTSSFSPAPHCRSPPFCHLAYPPLLAPGAEPAIPDPDPSLGGSGAAAVLAMVRGVTERFVCLLYTSDAADD